MNAIDEPSDYDLLMRTPGMREWIESRRARTVNPERDLLTVRQAAAYVGIAQSTFYTHIYLGNGPRQEADHPRRFLRVDLDDWIENRSTHPGRRKNE
ncbi:MAG: helix-turn-helix domain-containing protein [Bifidobacterium sp.]|jgi:predicted DNA-binding transcriptional regulator AlpA|nr:helix-turn-helix domain-containing protein [Bifidobacterium sp.]MCI1864449.1 helix-turn-helix domain-containing protein [Bifidobacterium sp.]